jgi:hypothetical protein
VRASESERGKGEGGGVGDGGEGGAHRVKDWRAGGGVVGGDLEKS